jgi:8-oxo-dGTP pyrophosphatase MutT (NUDIX family)
MTGEATLHSVSVAGVVIDENGRTLVIQRRDNGRWEPPGGVLERDEPIIEGLPARSGKRPGSPSSQ